MKRKYKLQFNIPIHYYYYYYLFTGLKLNHCLFDILNGIKCFTNFLTSCFPMNNFQQIILPDNFK